MSSSEVIHEDEKYWQKDEEAPVCNKCQRNFTLLRRRSHCRSCGKIFCHDCTVHKLELPHYFKRKGVQKVCDKCYLYYMNLHVKKDTIIERPNFENVRSELQAQINYLLQVDSSDWKETRNVRGINIFKLQMPDSNLYCFRTTVLVDAPPDMVWAIYKNDNLWINWQPEATISLVENVEPVQRGDTESNVLYIKYRLPIIDNRDSCIFSFWKTGTLAKPDQENSWTLLSRTIHHPACPPTKHYVRCFCSVSGTTVEPYFTPGKVRTKITSVLHIDPGGLIPAFFINTALSIAVDAIEKMRSWIEKNGAEYYSSIQNQSSQQ